MRPPFGALPTDTYRLHVPASYAGGLGLALDQQMDYRRLSNPCNLKKWLGKAGEAVGRPDPGRSAVRDIVLAKWRNMQIVGGDFMEFYF